MISMKFLILLFSYNRPHLIQEALRSVANSTHQDWHLALIDDASTAFDVPVTVMDIFSIDQINKSTFYLIEDTKEDKLARKGSWIGREANHAMLTIPSDVCVFLCDDDKLRPTYLEELNKYYTENPEVMYSYSHIHTFGEGADGSSWLNKTDTLDPFCQVDASQVTWRTSCITEGGVRFPFPKTSCLDSDLFGQLCEKYGLCPFNGITGQEKFIHLNQLGNHSSLDRID